VQLIDCDQRHVEPIREIFNEVIASSTALWDYQPRSASVVSDWLGEKSDAGLPIVGMTNASGDLLGFASYGTFRPWQAYKYAAEHSVYVASSSRRQGIGRLLLRELIARAKASGLRTLIGGITADNEASIALHQQLGFSHCGTIVSAGYKFGSWLDLSFYQLLLEGPAHPTER
jgi:phosphinothricin acetyltransferase